MGHGYKGNTCYHRSITENLPYLISKYEYHNGYFGAKGRGRDFVRNIISADPIKTAQGFYDAAGKGGIERLMINGRGRYSKMKDGSILSYRETSSSDGSPVVEINIKGSYSHGDLKYQKIHFVKGR